VSGICTGCGLPDEICVCEDIAREQQEIRITVDSRRYGKLMTIVSGMDEASIDVPGLMSKLKSKCACGGAYKGGNIELQGDHRKKVEIVLTEMGFDSRVD
jgi:translation initiation factor 1